jgi:hypothetical protein
MPWILPDEELALPSEEPQPDRARQPTTTAQSAVKR